MKAKLLFLLIAISQTAAGQTPNDDRPRQCTKHPTINAKYKTLSIDLGVELQIDVEVRSAHRTDENFVAIARKFRERYCENREMRITYFASKKQWEILDPRDPRSVPLAVYYFGRNTDRVGLHIYQMRNNKVETRDIDLTNYKDLTGK